MFLRQNRLASRTHGLSAYWGVGAYAGFGCRIREDGQGAGAVLGQSIGVIENRSDARACLGLIARVDRVACALAIAAVAFVLGCGGSEPEVGSKLDDVERSIERPLERLGEAVDEARPASRATLISLRVTAERAEETLDDAQRDLRDLEESSEGVGRERVRDLQAVVADYQSLAAALAGSPISLADLELAGERADQAAREARAEVPEIDAASLIASLRRSRAARAAETDSESGISAPVGPAPPSAPAPTQAFTYTSYSGPAFQARIPTGGGWAAPAQSEPTPGRLFRTSVRGPDGLFVIIDFTPFEAAAFGSSYRSRSAVGQTAFGSATRYVFQGGSLPECQRGTCVDYIINGGGAGFAVLAGGGPEATIAAIAQTVAESVTPAGEFGE